jgi:hypothetical protein
MDDELARAVAQWEIPFDAADTQAAREALLRTVVSGYDRPEDLATLAVPALVLTVGRLESRIVDLERHLDTLITVVQRLTG